MSARRREYCTERLKGVHGYRLVDTVLLHFIVWEGTQCCFYGEMKIVVEKPDYGFIERVEFRDEHNDC